METKIEYVICDCDCDSSYCDGGDSENNTSPVTVVLKVDLHCDACIAKIVRLASSLQGVETVRADPESNKITLIGFMDPVKITAKLQKKSKKKIELLSPKPKKKESKANSDTKADKQSQTMVAVSTVILKLSCSCDGCTKRIHKTISKTKGVYQVKMDKEKELVTVTGTMDVKSVTENLKRKLKKTVAVLPEKKKKNKDNKNKSEGNITKVVVASPGLGHYGYMEGPYSQLFSEEDGSFCSVM